MGEFKHRNPDHALDICGIVFNCSPSGKKTGPEARRSVEEVELIAKDNNWPVYSARIPVSASFARATRAGSPISGTKNVRPPTPQKFHAFARQFFESIGMEK
jgi:chromosome partitioning protein